MKIKLTYLLIMLASLTRVHQVVAQGTAFTYQGRLNNGSAPANGSYELTFTLYNTNITGVPVAGPVTNSAVAVTNGLFLTTVDFGPGVFMGGSNWLEIAVSTNGANAFTTLSPRQQVTPTPYAIYSGNAGSAVTASTASSVAAANISGALGLGQLPAGVITNGASGVMLSGILARGGPPGPNGVNNNGYAFSGNGGDDDSGMFSSADGQLEFYDNANEVMRIRVGQVGIGTTSPAGILDVEGPGGSAAPVILTAGSGVPSEFEIANGGPGANVIITGGAGAYGSTFYSGGPGGNLILKGGAGGNTEAFEAGGSGGNLILLPGVGGTPIFGGTIGNPGNVGIGTTNPVGRLNVIGTGGAGQGLQFDNREIKFRGDGDAHWSIFANRIQGKLTIEDTSANSFNGVAGIVAITVEKTSGNVGIGTTSPGALLVVGGFGSPAYCNGTTWVNGSDRNSKEDFAAINPRAVLEKVSALPITEWRYKTEAGGTEHLGPMAQDFHAAFGLNGTDDKHIATVDEEGVALAAIQGLNQKLEETRVENTMLKHQNDLLAERLNELEATVQQLAAQK